MPYKHALVLNPYAKEYADTMDFFPPTGLEYVATAMGSVVERISLVDLRRKKRASWHRKYPQIYRQ